MRAVDRSLAARTDDARRRGNVTRSGDARERAANDAIRGDRGGSSQTSASTGALPAALRGDAERMLGSDLGDVRIHTGSEAAGLAASVSARAYALGNDLVFGAGEYAPHLPAGRRMLLHELAHVAQARGDRTEMLARFDDAGVDAAVDPMELPPEAATVPSMDAGAPAASDAGASNDLQSCVARMTANEYRSAGVAPRGDELSSANSMCRTETNNPGAPDTTGSVASYQQQLRNTSLADYVPTIPWFDMPTGPQPWWRFAEAGNYYQAGRYDIFQPHPGVETGFGPLNLLANLGITGLNMVGSLGNVASRMAAIPEAIAREMGMSEQDIAAMNFALMMTGLGEVRMATNASVQARQATRALQTVAAAEEAEAVATTVTQARNVSTGVTVTTEAATVVRAATVAEAAVVRSARVVLGSSGATAEQRTAAQSVVTAWENFQASQATGSSRQFWEFLEVPLGRRFAQPTEGLELIQQMREAWTFSRPALQRLFRLNATQGTRTFDSTGRCATWAWTIASRNAGWSGAVVADDPAFIGGLIRMIRNRGRYLPSHPLNNPIVRRQFVRGGAIHPPGSPGVQIASRVLRQYDARAVGTARQLRQSARQLRPGQQVYVSGVNPARPNPIPNGPPIPQPSHAMVGVVQHDGTLLLQHSPGAFFDDGIQRIYQNTAITFEEMIRKYKYFEWFVFPDLFNVRMPPRPP